MKRQPYYYAMTALLTGTALALAGCNVWKEPPPRYNTVTGQKRAPILNPGGKGPSDLSMNAAMHASQPGANAPLPPHASATMPKQEMTPYDMAEQEDGMHNLYGVMGGDESSESVAAHQAMQRKAPLMQKQEAMMMEAPEATVEMAAPVEPMREPMMPAMEMAAPTEPPMQPLPEPQMKADMPDPEMAEQEKMASEWRPVSPEPMPEQPDEYPQLAATPPAPEGTAERMQAARMEMEQMHQESMQAAMHKQTVETEAMQEMDHYTAAKKAMQHEQSDMMSSDEIDDMFAGSQPMPEPVEWQPTDMAPPPAAYEPSAPEADEWQAVGEEMPAPPQPEMQAYAPPPPAQPAWQPEPVMAPPAQVMQEVPADMVATRPAMEPIQLVPPSSIRQPRTLPDSRYAARREAERLRRFQ